MDEVGASCGGVVAWSEGGSAAMQLAASHPKRVVALILIGTTARFVSGDDYPAGVPRALMETAIEAWAEVWGTGDALQLYGPSVADDPRMRRWWAAYQRFAATPGAVSASLRMQLVVDMRATLPQIRAPTLIIHRRDDMLIPVTCARYMAAHIPNSRYLELPGYDHMYWLGDQDATLSAIRDFLSETPEGMPIKRIRRGRGRARFGWESLTEAELDVVRLLAEGLTNKEIARRLYVSPRTVQAHVAHIFDKLSAESRAEVAAQAARRLV
jgi:DNA-binding CsgD family transcriptional regulator